MTTRGAALSPVSHPLLLSPHEHEILSICLESSEDPRDIGMLVALLSVEWGTSASKESLP
jgi:hypothetical protein